MKNNIIEQLVALRQERGYSQRALAEMAGISYVHIAKIETEKTSPSLDILLKIADALNATISISPNTIIVNGEKAICGFDAWYEADDYCRANGGSPYIAKRTNGGEWSILYTALDPMYISDLRSLHGLQSYTLDDIDEDTESHIVQDAEKYLTGYYEVLYYDGGEAIVADNEVAHYKVEDTEYMLCVI